MTDKDILLSDLNDISEILNNNGYGGWCETIRKAVDLLKEQPQIVRCENCKHRGFFSCGWDTNRQYAPPDDWFCADGDEKNE